MKLTTTSNLLALAAASTVSAQAAYTNQSAPFTLQIANSANASLNGNYLFACHAGAAIEGICLGNSTPSGVSSTFYFNTTDTDSGVSGDTTQGQLVWNLPISGLPGVDHVGQPALFPFNYGTNVVVPTFGLGGQDLLVQFTDGDKLTLRTYYDDSNLVQGQFPTSSGTPITLNNWYVCWTGVGVSYTYEALAWVTAGQPNNPTCQKVDVVRTFL